METDHYHHHHPRGVCNLGAVCAYARDCTLHIRLPAVQDTPEKLLWQSAAFTTKRKCMLVTLDEHSWLFFNVNKILKAALLTLYIIVCVFFMVGCVTLIWFDHVQTDWCVRHSDLGLPTPGHGHPTVGFLFVWFWFLLVGGGVVAWGRGGGGHSKWS